MRIGRHDLVRTQRAHVLAWPARHAETIDGWLWRSSGGGSQRANSVSTIDFTGDDVEAAIDRVEARYRAVGSPVRFQTFDETAPPDLVDRLLDRGYENSSATLTMIKPTTATACRDGVESHDHATDEWLDVYLGTITADRRAANADILERITGPSAFFSLRRNGAVIATALSVVNLGCAVIECVATRAEARRQGAARDLLAGPQFWAAQRNADLMGLQVDSQNTAAIALYSQLGFRGAGRNLFWRHAS